MAIHQTPINIGNTSTVVSTLNTTTTLLGAAQTWTGAFESTTQWIQGDIASFSDVPGTLYLDLSNDGVTIIASPSFASTGNVAVKTPFNFQWVRIRYTNGATPQSSFSLQTVWRPVFSGTAVVPLNSSIFPQSTGELVRAVLDTENSLSLGTFQHLRSENGRLLVKPSSDTTTTPSASIISDFVSAGKVFLISDQVNLASAGSDNLVFLLRNPSGSGKTFYLYRVLYGMSIVNTNANFKLKKNPTITAVGTTVTPINSNINHSNTSSMNTYKASTINGGTQLSSLTVGQNNNSLDFLGDFSIFLQAGNDLIVTGDPNSNNRECTITIMWAEV